ncbi:hypothetical protein [Hyalangium versicolor]|uniref:hypothetical protein n=1 Tax=Hyalangium versicolor TaxID=2861190 RepID=UPI001CCC2447|nr:hypothetical protein [Hyalangium versicolor]
MSDDRKKLMPEILPKPVAASGAASVRQRVLKHLNVLIAAGTTTVTMACQPPYGVVDPLPPPARCRTTGSVLDVLDVTAWPGTSGVLVRIYVNDESGEVSLRQVVETLGGVADRVNLDGYPAEIHLIPNSPNATIELKLATECARNPAATVRIVLRPNTEDGGATGYSVTTSDDSQAGGP